MPEMLTNADLDNCYVSVNSGRVLVGSLAKFSANQEIYTTSTITSSGTLTAAQVSGASIVDLNMTGSIASGQTATLPSVASVIAAMPVAVSSYKLRMINSSAGAGGWTLAAGANWTVNGTKTVAQNTTRDWIVTIDNSAGTAVAQTVGVGTFS